jgi:hypothetical protein
MHATNGAKVAERNQQIEDEVEEDYEDEVEDDDASLADDELDTSGRLHHPTTYSRTLKDIYGTHIIERVNID